LNNPGHRKLPAASATVALAPAGGIPRAPKSLGKVGRSSWRRIWTAGQQWLSPQTDYDILARLCEAHDEREALRQQIERDGRILFGRNGESADAESEDGEAPKGAPYVHPAVWLLMKVDAVITRYEQLCGLNPSARSQLGLAEVKRVSKLASFLSQQGGGSAR
jgi:P27 family predicted phage terminase small subunit